jgi:hypothetical protein
VVAKQADGSACPGTRLPTTTVSDVRKAVFSELNTGGITVGSTINQCSFGKSKLTQQNSQVAQPVELPCAGNT